MSLTCFSLDSALQHCCNIAEFPRLQGAVCSVPHRPWLPAQVHLQESRATSNTAVTAQLTGVSSGLGGMELGLGALGHSDKNPGAREMCNRHLYWAALLKTPLVFRAGGILGLA